MSDSVIISNCVIDSNSSTSTSSSFGGGIFVLSGTKLVISGSKINGNTSTSYSSSYGGGISVSGGTTLVISGSEIKGNLSLSSSSSYSFSNGGGLYFWGGTKLVISGSEIKGNTTKSISNSSSASYSQGGGIYVESASKLVISGSEIKGNNNTSFSMSYSYSAGGGLYAISISDSAIVSNSVIDSNSSSSSSSYGGGMYLSKVSLNMSKSVIKNNVSKYGGGIHVVGYKDSRVIEISNSLFSNDTAENRGSAIYSMLPVKLINCTVVKNYISGALFSANPSDIYLDSNLISVNSILKARIYKSNKKAQTKFYYTNVYPAYEPDTSVGLISIDTIFIDEDGGDYRLASNSSLIDAGTEDSLYIKIEDYPYDLAGNNRRDGVVDIGAYEHVNEAPVTEEGSIIVNEDDSVAYIIVSRDVDGEVVSYELEEKALNGEVRLVKDTVYYKPLEKYYGVDSFYISTTDNKGAKSNIAKISIKVNAYPESNDTIMVCNEDERDSIILTSTDVDGTIIGYIVADSAMHGTVEIQDSLLIYTPNANYNGVDEISYQSIDNNGAKSNIAKINVTVNSVNDVPVAYDDSLICNEDERDSIVLTSTDVDGTIIGYIVADSAMHGTVEIQDSLLIYTPNANYNGVDEISYQSIDNDSAKSNVAKITVTVNSVNDVPVAIDLVETTKADSTVLITLLAIDVEGEIQDYIIKSGPLHGNATLNGDKITYTPSVGYIGDDTITYVARDLEDAESNVATIVITVKKSTSLLTLKEQDPDKLKIYPNPVLDIVNVQSQIKGEVYIMDINGYVVKKVSTKKLNIKDLPKGIYFVVVKESDKIKAVKSFYKR